MHITKTDYLEYTYCRKNLWLKKHKPELFVDVELSEFEKKIIEEGNAADAAAREIFLGGVLVEIVGPNAAPFTQDLVTQKTRAIFQGAFLSNPFFVQADVLHFNEALDGWELYEVKATNEVKRTIPHHHINDVAFQKNVLEATGLRIVRAGVIHLNREYQKQDEIDYRQLFIVEDLTDEICEAQAAVRDQMREMEAYLQDPEERGCQCLYRGHNAQCTTFRYSNPDVPDYSVHDINRIGASKKLLFDWIDRGIYAIDDIDNAHKLTGVKRAQHNAYRLGKPLIDHEGIAQVLSELVFPLAFFDYEGYSSAIPRFDGFGTYEQVPFQYSLHLLEKDGTLTHKECLLTDPGQHLTLPLVEQMKQDFEHTGSVISWYKSYEQQRNDKLAKLHPGDAEFFTSLNDRMFDLMSIFSTNLYVDARFKGSASIKNVLPVLVPHLTYKNLGIQKGDQAVERWEKLIDPQTSQKEKDQITRDLLEYCKLDTLAMVEIYQFLIRLTN